MDMKDLLAKAGLQISEEAKKELEEKKKEDIKKENDKFKNYNDRSKGRPGGDRSNSGNGNNSRGNNDRGNNGYGRDNGGGRNYQRNNDSYVGAPYNFVPFTEKVKTLENGLVSHADMSDELYSGEISYTITAKSPIFVGANQEGFYKTAKGRYAIPGSTIRGLIRSNVQILGCSSFGSDIDDYALMYRTVGARNDNPNKKEYDNILGSKLQQLPDGGGSVSILENVKAGYLENKDGKYIIRLTNPEKVAGAPGVMNYYVINERIIIKKHLKDPEDESFTYLFDNNLTQNNPNVGFTREERNGRVQYKGQPNKDYVPYYQEISYQLTGTKNVSAVGAPDKYPSKGYIVGSGYMQQKKALYIIPEVDRDADYIEISDKDIQTFKIDYEKKKNNQNIKQSNGYFNLPESGKMRPVFYITIGSKLYFGYTPRLRLFYDHTVKEGLPESHINVKRIDLAESMFGYAKDSGYKSKLSFTDAVVANTPQKTGDTVKVILGEPKASSYNDYIEPDKDGNAISYLKNGFRLRGVKQYWLREEPWSNANGKNENVASSLSPLDKGTQFRGVIRYDNLTQEELGLLLWAVRLEDNSCMNIGKGKPFGYGRISVKIDKIRRWDNAKAYSSDILVLDPWDDSLNVDDLINKYKDGLKAFLKVDDLMKVDSFKVFFAMKNDENKPDPQKIRYMNIDNREYQNRAPLPKAMEVLDKK